MKLLAKKPAKVVAIALANKMARIAGLAAWLHLPPRSLVRVPDSPYRSSGRGAEAYPVDRSGLAGYSWKFL